MGCMIGRVIVAPLLAPPGMDATARGDRCAGRQADARNARPRVGALVFAQLAPFLLIGPLTTLPAGRPASLVWNERT